MSDRAHSRRSAPEEWKATGITLNLSDELGRRLAEEAARQAVTPEQLATSALAEYIATRPHARPVAPGEPTIPAAQTHRPKTVTAHPQQTRHGRKAVRVIGEVPVAIWLGLFFFMYAAMFILIVVVTVKALA